MQPRRWDAPSICTEDTVKDGVLVLRHDLRSVFIDEVGQTPGQSEGAFCVGLTVEPIEVRLRLDLSPAEANLAMSAVSSLISAGTVVEMIAIQSQDRFRVPRER